MPEASNQSNLIWIDCEFTSLNFDTNKIVEIAVVVTNSNLEVLGEPISCIIHHSRDDLNNLLEEWPRTHFEHSGLLEEIAQGTLSMRRAEDLALEYIAKHCTEATSPLCGNSVGQDRRILYTNMPRLEAFLHYRTIDVSTLKELSLRWNPLVQNHIEKKGSHRALDDIFESIEELKIYRNLFLK